MRVRMVFVAIAAAALVAGCGGGEKKQEKPAKTAETPTNNPPVEPKKSGAPQELLGQYEVKIPETDLPSEAPEDLATVTDVWVVTLAETGGPGDGPAFSIANGQAEPIETSSFQVKGDRIILTDETCAAEGKPVDAEFTYELSGDELTLSSPKNTCPDKLSETILTSKPLTKRE
jgi:hypothetical protein